MKFVLALAVLSLASCATLNEKYPAIPEAKLMDSYEKLTGKTPKEIVAMYGKPISVGTFTRRDGDWYIAYPISNQPVSMMSFMGGGYQCSIMRLHQEYDHKFQYSDRFSTDCSDLKTDYKYDDSIIK